MSFLFSSEPYPLSELQGAMVTTLLVTKDLSKYLETLRSAPQAVISQYHRESAARTEASGTSRDLTIPEGVFNARRDAETAVANMLLKLYATWAETQTDGEEWQKAILRFYHDVFELRVLCELYDRVYSESPNIPEEMKKTFEEESKKYAEQVADDIKKVEIPQSWMDTVTAGAGSLFASFISFEPPKQKEA